jgi:hypothetical protein
MSGRIELSHQKRFCPVPPEWVDMSLIHDGMREFAVTWSQPDTKELVMLIPRYAFRGPGFGSVEVLAKSSNLCQRFSTNVVLLRALILHQFNYLRSVRYGAVSKSLWDSRTCFVSCEDAADLVTNEIAIGPIDNLLLLVVVILRNLSFRK